MEITIRLYKNNRVIKRVTADRTKWTKLYSKLASAQAQKYLVYVDYGKHKDTHGKRVTFYNEYYGTSKREAKHALKAFIEK